jgi:DTW domain-containing protein YfiP
MRFTLLTHRKELGKRSATGPLVVEVLGDRARQLVWQRTVPSASLLAAIAAGRVALVWPGEGGVAADALGPIDELVLPDGTWLTARKIHQKSPYLHHLPRVSLRPQAPSRYTLRPNQKAGGLCTAETVIALLRDLGDVDTAERLQQRFEAFLPPPPRDATSALPRLIDGGPEAQWRTATAAQQVAVGSPIDDHT